MRQNSYKMTHTKLKHITQLFSRYVLSESLRPHGLGSSVQKISQARILEWVAISFRSAFSKPRDRICICCIGKCIFNCWSTRKAPYNSLHSDKYKPVQNKTLIKIMNIIIIQEFVSHFFSVNIHNFPPSTIQKQLLIFLTTD